MTISDKAALVSIQKGAAHLPSTTHERILEQMRADGLLYDEDGAVHAAAASRPSLRHMTVIQAAEAYPETAPRLRRVKAMAARMGFQIHDDKKISVFELDQAIRGQDLDRRMELKSELAQLHLILP